MRRFDSTRPLRVVHLGKYYPPAPGGIETHLQTLARAQAYRGIDVQVVVVNHADDSGEDQTFSRWVRTSEQYDCDGPVRVIRVGRMASVAKLDVCPRLLTHLRRLEREGVDLFHLHTPNPTMLLALIALGDRTPIVVMHHSDIVRQRFLKHLFTPFERLIYRRARALIASSEAYVSASPLLSAFRDKVRIVPFGLELREWMEPSVEAITVHSAWRNQYEPPIWFIAGRLIYYKGIETALEALAEVPGTLVIVGTGPLRDRLQARAKELGVDRRVIWKGHVSRAELVGAYHAATAFWFPSNARSEAFGLVQVEAMACGCPVINTQIPGSGVPWVSLDRETGITVPVNQPRAFARAANELTLKPELRDRYAKAAVERVRREFSHEVMSERTVQVYREVLR